MTFENLQTLVYDLLRQSSTNTEYTSTVVKSMLNISHKELLRDTKCYLVSKDATLTGSTYILDSTDIATANTEIESIHSVVFKNPSTSQKYSLQEIPYETVEGMYDNTDTPETSTDLDYYGYRNTTTNTLCFYPSPSSNATVTVNAFCNRTDDMTGSSDTPTGLPTSYHYLCAYLAAYKLLVAESEGNAIPFFQSFIQPGIASLTQWTFENYPEPPKLFGTIYA